jgi:hypothetical protein
MRVFNLHFPFVPFLPLFDLLDLRAVGTGPHWTSWPIWEGICRCFRSGKRSSIKVMRQRRHHNTISGVLSVVSSKSRDNEGIIIQFVHYAFFKNYYPSKGTSLHM